MSNPLSPIDIYYSRGRSGRAPWSLPVETWHVNTIYEEVAIVYFAIRDNSYDLLS